MSSTPVIIPAIIDSVQGTNPGPASGISYTVKMSFPSGTVAVVSGVKPHNWRWPNTLDTQAATPGTAVLAYDVGGQMQFFICEGLATTECAP